MRPYTRGYEDEYDSTRDDRSGTDESQAGDGRTAGGASCGGTDTVAAAPGDECDCEGAPVWVHPDTKEGG